MAQFPPMGQLVQLGALTVTVIVVTWLILKFRPWVSRELPPLSRPYYENGDKARVAALESEVSKLREELKQVNALTVEVGKLITLLEEIKPRVTELSSRILYLERHLPIKS